MTNLSLTPGDSWIDGILEEFNWRQFVEGDDSEDIDQSSSLTVHTVAAVLRITTAVCFPILSQTVSKLNHVLIYIR